jgi:DnaJ-class molecular chaperone
MTGQETVSNLERAAALMGVAPSASDQELRSAYLKKVQEHPPDRDPEIFEQIRDAYEQLRDPMARAQTVLEGPSPSAPLTSLLDGSNRNRAFVGSALWIELLREKRS